jgi:hypothetical protein
MDRRYRSNPFLAEVLSTEDYNVRKTFGKEFVFRDENHKFPTTILATNTEMTLTGRPAIVGQVEKG